MPPAPTHPIHSHPLEDGQGDFIIDLGSAVNIVSQLIQILLAFMGPEQVKNAVDWEYSRQVKLAADATKVTTDMAADAIEDSRFGPSSK